MVVTIFLRWGHRNRASFKMWEIPCRQVEDLLPQLRRESLGQVRLRLRRASAGGQPKNISIKCLFCFVFVFLNAIKILKHPPPLPPPPPPLVWRLLPGEPDGAGVRLEAAAGRQQGQAARQGQDGGT